MPVNQNPSTALCALVCALPTTNHKPHFSIVNARE
jgi:hypothetical protein